MKAELTEIENSAEPIVREIGREAADVYVLLAKEFSKGSIIDNRVFQFAYRSFYREGSVRPCLKRERPRRISSLALSKRSLRCCDRRSPLYFLHGGNAANLDAGAYGVSNRPLDYI